MYDLAVIWDWVAFSVRWLHVITAMAWIGASFYFIALDLMLKPNSDLPKGAHGEEWKVTAAVSTTPSSTWLRLHRCPGICAGIPAVVEHAEACLRAGTSFVALSLGAFADPLLLARVRAVAADGCARLIRPSGAIAGIDLIEALSLGLPRQNVPTPARPSSAGSHPGPPRSAPMRRRSIT